MNNNNTCTLKDCRLRTCLTEIPEDDSDYSEDYPFNAYGIECHVTCRIRAKEEM